MRTSTILRISGCGRSIDNSGRLKSVTSGGRVTVRRYCGEKNSGLSGYKIEPTTAKGTTAREGAAPFGALPLGLNDVEASKSEGEGGPRH